MSSVYSSSSVVDDLSQIFPSKAYISQDNNSHKNATDRMRLLINKIDDEKLYNMIQIEFEHMLIDQQRLVKMLQQQSDLLQSENDEMKVIITDIQRRYEKAVREMQFFKKKYDRLVQSNTDCGNNQTENYSISMLEVASRGRNNSNTGNGSIYSSFSSSTESTSMSYSHKYDNPTKKTFSYTVSRNPSMASSYSTPSTVPSSIFSANTHVTSASSVISSSSTNASKAQSIIQQRKLDPLTFGGSDALWDTISKSQGNDATVEKIISNFLRRGGSPNTAKQSPPVNNVRYGYGMIHALIVTKSVNALDLLLQQGANPNATTMSQIDEDKVSPCYLAASVGWLVGLQKIVEAGGDLISARGGGHKKKTALHAAAEHGYTSVVEYIVTITEGTLNQQTDSMGINALHYACLSGNTDIVSFLIKVCQISGSDTDHKGETPLHWAARHGHLEVVTLLVEIFRCNINAYVSKKVGTPYDFAKSAGHKKVAEYLKNNGGITAKKMDKRKEELLAQQVPYHLESALAKNGFFMDAF